MDIKAALHSARQGKAILFIGAGFSIGAPNVAGGRMLGAVGFAKHLADCIGEAIPMGLEDISEEFLAIRGEDSLIHEVRQHYGAVDVDFHHRVLAAQPWRRVYTTNYDDVFEVASKQSARNVRPVVLSDDVRAVPKSQNLVVHLNGFIHRLDRASLGNELKLAEVSYVTASIQDSEWAAFFRQDLRMADAVFFIGYSLADLDIRRILYMSDLLREKCFFILGRNAEPHILRRVSRFGTPLKIDAEMIALLFHEAAIAEPDVERSLEPVGVSLRVYTEPDTEGSLSDETIFKLMAYGDYREDLVWQAQREDKPYLLFRDRLDFACALVERERYVVLYSDLANGKSIFIETMKYSALQKGLRVYYIESQSSSIFAEMDNVFSSPDRSVIFLDNYPDQLDVVRYFVANAPSSFCLVLSARSLSHDVLADRLLEIVGNDNLPEVRLDKLSDSDVAWFVDLLESYGLWGKRASWSRERKFNLLAGYCKREVHAVLLQVLRAPQIADRLKAVMGEVQRKDEDYLIVVSIIILVVLNHPVDIDIITDYWGVEAVNSRAFRSNAGVRQLVDFRRDEIGMRSSVVGWYLLREYVDAGAVLAALKGVAQVADKLRHVSLAHSAVMKNIMRFGSLQLVFPDKGRRKAIIAYYEHIKSLSSCRRNPLFWLQYGIACLVLEEFERAGQYFDTAYSLADGAESDTVQIDNHYARFLLLEIVDSGESHRAMASFRKARKIINDQVRDERRHYPFRVAKAYSKFIERFGRDLNSQQVAEVSKAAEFLLSVIERLPEERRLHRYVRECAEEMEYVVLQCDVLLGAESAD